MGDPLTEIVPDIRVVSIIVRPDGTMEVDWDKFSAIELSGLSDALALYAQEQLEKAICPDEEEGEE